MAYLHAGQRKGGAQLREHTGQQIGWQFQWYAHLENVGAGSFPAGDGREHPLVLCNDRAALA
jgi:hypothetical protein